MSSPGWSRIINGETVNKGDPVAASTVIIARGDRQAVCTASIIAPGLLLTAAHCVTSGLSVTFGTALSDWRAPRRSIRAMEIHPNYKPVGSSKVSENDIAVMTFQGDIPPGYSVAKLLPADRDLRAGEMIIAAGYGSTAGAKLPDGLGTLRKTKITVSDAQESWSEVTVDQSHGTGICSGDSGGPGFVVDNGEYYLFGVADRVQAEKYKESCSYQAVYAKVTFHQEWIQKMIAKYPPTPEKPKKKHRFLFF